MVDMKVSLSSLTLDNPVIPASGVFGYGKEFAELYGMLSPNERQHVKSIIIGIQLAKEAEKEVALA